ncbi:Deleted in malignant brain tumors 1 protein [Geodia barretti]|nr:Deleted in malignant brain tumors 1 protein [Geodia barretti]
MSGVRKSTIMGESVEIEVRKELKLTSISERDKGLHIKSNGKPVSVVALSEEGFSADLFLVLPPVYIPDQYVYYAVSVRRDIVQEATFNSAILVVATEDGTVVMLSPTTNVSLSSMSDINGTGIAGQPISVILNETNTLYVTSPESLSGSKVVSNKPITFISGHECGNIPTGISFCDHMFEQIPPTSTWGIEFYSVPLKTRESFDVIMLLASKSDTMVTCVCNPPMETTNLIISTAGGVVSVNVSSEQYCRFMSNKPVLVVQLAVASGVDNVSADPFMMIIPPFGQYRSKYLIPTFEPQYERNLSYFVNIVLVTDNQTDIDFMLLDESRVSANWTEIFCDVNEHHCAYGAQLDVNVSDTAYILSHVNPDVLFSATVYSFGMRIGQGFAAGFNQKPIALHRVTLSASVFEANESDGALEVMLMLQRSSTLSNTVSIRLKTRDLQETTSAIADVDYFPIDTEVVFDPDESSKLVSINLPEDDVFPEANKTFEVYITATPGVLISPIGFAYATILNDDEPLPVVNISFGITSISVLEGNGFVELVLTKSEGAVGAVSVNLNTVDGTAVAGIDYEPLSTVITFEQQDVMATVRVKVLNNPALQQKRMFSAVIEVTPGLRFPAQVIDSVATINIDDDDMIVIGVNPVTQEVTEGSNATINMEILSGSLEKDVVVSLTSVEQSAKGGEDYMSPRSSVTFSKSKSFNSVFISIFNDDQLELPESFSISLSHHEGESVLILPIKSTIWILDNDDVEIGLVVNTATVREGDTIPVTVRVINGDLSVPVEVSLSTLSRTAIEDDDFERIQDMRLIFDEDTVEYNLTIATYDNPISVGSKDFAVQLSLKSGARVRLAPSTMSITVLDDDSLPSMTCHQDTKCLSDNGISVSSIDLCCNQLRGKSVEFSAAQGTCQPCINIDFSRSEYILLESLMNNTVPVTVTGGRLPIDTVIEVNPDESSSNAGFEDFKLYSPTIELGMGSTGSTIMLEIVLDDFRNSEDAVESFILQLLHSADILPQNVVLGTAVIRVMNVVPVLSIEQSVYRVDEEDGNVSIRVSVVGERTTVVNFSIVTSNESATVGVDYSSLITSFSVQPDDRDVLFNIDIIDDDIVEKEEFLDLGIRSESVGVLVENRYTHIRIRDFDIAIVRFMETSYTVREDTGQIEICVVIDGRVDFDFTVGLSTVDGTAGEEDFEAVSTILTFSREESVKCVAVSVINDAVLEETELFLVTLTLRSDSNQIKFDNSMTTVEILNVFTQNVTVEFERTSFVVSENNQVTIVIAATGNFDGPITLMLAVSPETDDYTLQTPSTIEPTLSQFPIEVLISIVDDCKKEGNETFFLSLTSPGQLGVTIVNDRASITVLDLPVKFNDDVLQFLDLGFVTFLPPQDDSISEAILPPEGFRAFGQTYSNLYVTTNGVITLGVPALECCPVRFEDIHFGAAAFVSPYWIDNDPSIEGNVSYSVVVRDNELLQTVSNYIAQSQRISFNGTWMLIAYWLDVPEALLKQQVNSYQAVLITNGIRSFAVFIYNCNKLDPQSVAGIGYYFNESVQMEHVYASTSNSSQVACENYPCTPWNSIVYPLFDAVCEGQVRLADEVVPGVGRVEICFNDEWGTVCDDNWDINDATVVCRQLGFPSSSHTAIGRAMFGEGAGTIWLDEVACSGTESELQDCAHNGVGINNCRHREDASVACVFECSSGTVRLSGGNATAGRVEVCYNNVWGTICDDSWDVNDARVVCNQLNLPSSSAIPIRNAGFGEGGGVIWLDDVSCAGDEESLQSCPNLEVGVHNCGHDEDAGVVCGQEQITVGYDPATYVTTESDRSVTLTVRVFSHPGGAPQSFTLVVNTEDGTATVDYVPVAGEIIQFNAGDITQTHTITINDDNDCEENPNENFFSNFVLDRGFPDVTVTVPQATVTIDDSGEIECDPIEVGYEFSVYTTTEGTGVVTLCTVVINFPGGSPRPFTINATTEDGSAVSGSDYAGVVDVPLMFEVGDDRVCHDVVIIDGDDCETPFEDFFSNLEYYSGDMPIIITRDRTRVNINDTAEPECVIQVGYEDARYSVNEGDGEVELCVTTQRPVMRPFVIISTTMDLSAVAPIDYDGVISELVFNTGDSRICYTISIVDDDLCEEPSENLLAQLRVQNENAVEYRLEFTEVVIEDDAEPECADVTCPSLPHPANGVVLLTNLTEGSLATYLCNEGFGLAGDRGRICQSDGMWSGEAPICVASVLQYLDLGDDVGGLHMEDNRSDPITVPGQIPVFGQRYSTLYVIENGVIFFGMVTDEFSPHELSADDFPYSDTKPFVAPYWIENDLSQGGNVSYGVFTEDSTLLIEVSDFISQSESVEFSGTWMLVAYWINVPFFGSSDEDEVLSNTYQAVVITDGSSTYTVFTYLCNDLDNTTLGGRIGYYNDSCNFVEDPSSSAQMSFMVACENEDISLWNNIVYHLTPDGDSLQLLDLGVTNDVIRVFLPSANDELSGNISSPSTGFPLIGTRATRFNVHTNGLIVINGQVELLSPRMFSMIVSGSFVAPYWVDNDPSMGGSVSYEVHEGDSPLLRRVSCSISSREDFGFSGTWMLVVYWFNVPLFDTTMTSTYQGILITDGNDSYAVFIYVCEGLAVDASARIGYYLSPEAFTEHRLSGSQPSNIGCEEPVVIYKLTN